MVRFLTNLVLLKEIDGIDGLEYTSSDLKQKYPQQIIVIRHVSYIYSECLCEIALNKVTILDDYLQIGELADRMSIRVDLIQDRVALMKINPQRVIFEFIEICNMHFIKIDTEFRYLLENYQPFYVKLKELKDPSIKVKMLGDIKIGFY